jgi:hypothetical protein
MIYIHWLTIVGLALLTYIVVASFVLGWYLSLIPKQPKKELSGWVYGSHRVPDDSYKAHCNGDGYWRWHTSQEWIEWDEKYGEAYVLAHSIAWCWPAMILYLPFWVVFRAGGLSAKRVNAVISKQKEEAERLKVIMDANEEKLKALRIEAEKELNIEFNTTFAR